MRIALVGNPNSGKTTLFNKLTKLNQKIGNWPGVTVEKKSGYYFKEKEIEIIDLPGVYSLNAISTEEKVTQDFLQNKSCDIIVNIVDSTNLERNLALTMQLVTQVNLPIVLALNMADELKASGLTINTNKIEETLGVSCVEISALKNKNLPELIAKAKAAKKVAPQTLQKLTVEFSAVTTGEEKAESIQHFISKKIGDFRQKGVSKLQQITDKIDKVVLNKWLAFPVFAAVIFIMYFVSIQVIGALGTSGIEWLFNDVIGANLAKGLKSVGAFDWLIALIVDGIIAGVGAVIAFVPQILMLFLFISLLEGCGYMARVAFIMDRIFKKIGLSGKSFIPMIIGCGCSVPAIMSAKTLDTEQDRKTTIMLTPFIPCSAKLPVFALISGALFPRNPFAAPSMYFLGIFMVILCGFIINIISRKRAIADTFIMEMPQYRVPSGVNVLNELWQKAKGFLIKAGTIIFVASIVVWFLQSFSWTFKMVDNPENSIIASIGRVIAVLFKPLGFGNWQTGVAIITGLLAKETIVTTFGVLFASTTDLELTTAISTLFGSGYAAYAFMAFVLLSAPCFAAIGATMREMGSVKWGLMAIGFQTTVAYIVALIINQMGNLISYNLGAFISVIILIVVAVAMAFSFKHIIKRRKQKGCAYGCSSCDGCDKKS